MTGHRRPMNQKEVTEGATVESHWLNTINTSLTEVKATVVLHEKCTVMGAGDWRNDTLLMRPMYGIVTVLWAPC